MIYLNDVNFPPQEQWSHNLLNKPQPCVCTRVLEALNICGNSHRSFKASKMVFWTVLLLLTSPPYQLKRWWYVSIVFTTGFRCLQVARDISYCRFKIMWCTMEQKILTVWYWLSVFNFLCFSWSDFSVPWGHMTKQIQSLLPSSTLWWCWWILFKISSCCLSNMASQRGLSNRWPTRKESVMEDLPEKSGGTGATGGQEEDSFL